MTKLSSIYAKPTTSNVPKTPRQRKIWEGARNIVASQEGIPLHGKMSDKQKKKYEKSMSWGLVQHIYKNAEEKDKIPKRTDWDKTPSKTMQARSGFSTRSKGLMRHGKR